MFLVVLLPETMLMTWVDNHIQRSILSAVLFHFMESFTSELVTLTKQAEGYQVLLWILPRSSSP
jgi:hypothetical protein